MSLDVEIAQVASDTLVKLKVVWDEIGSTSDDRRRYVDQMAQDVLAVYENCYHKAIIYRDELKQNIAEQMEYLRTMSEELGESSFFEFASIEQLPLNLQLTQLTEKVDSLEHVRTERAVHLEALVEQLRLIQSEIGVELDYTYAKQVGSSTELDGSNVSLDGTKDFSLQHVKNVEDTLNKALEEKAKREKEVTELEADLIELTTELGHKAGSPISYRLRDSSMAQLRDRVSALFQVRAKRQEELAALAEKITTLWDKLDVEASLREAWVLQNSGKITDNVIQACETELTRLHELFAVHLAREIEAASARLHTLWDELSIPDVDRTMPSLEGCTDEERLAKIVNHKASLEAHLAQIRPIIELINEREHLHAEKLDFEEKASNPNRLLSKKTKRDPGWLLKEEQIRKSFTTKLPKLETALRKALTEYQHSHNTPFMYNGEPYLDRMLTQEEKEKRKKEEEKTRKEKEKAQQLEKELLFGSTVPVPTAKTPGKTRAPTNPQTPFTPRTLNTSVLQNSKRKRPALSPISTNIPTTLLTPQHSPKKMAHGLNTSLMESTQLRFDNVE